MPAGYSPAGGYPSVSQAGYPQAPYDAGIPQRPKRPWNITLVAILSLLAGLIEAVAGVAALFARNEYQLQADTGLSSGEIAIYGLVSLVIGAVILLLSFGLFGGSRMARGVIAFFSVVHIALALGGMFLVHTTNYRINLGWQIFWSLIVLILLFAGTRTKAFFARG